MRATRLFTLALLSTATLGLTACGSGGDPSPSPSIADAATLAAVAWSEAADGTPTLTFETPLVVSGASARLIQDGDGAALEVSQVLSLDYVAFSGVDGTLRYSTYEAGAPEFLTLIQDQIEPSLWNVLVDAHVGAQIVFVTPDGSALPTDDVYPSIVIAMTVSGVTVVPDRAEGDAVIPADGLPQVTLAENGAPSIDITGTEMPTSLVVQPLIVGSGAPVVEGQTLTVHYTGWIWDGAQFDSSWDSGNPATFFFAQGYLVDGWIQGLTGQTVGSQVLLVIPPELGYGEDDYGPIPGGSTLIFVVDILTAI